MAPPYQIHREADRFNMVIFTLPTLNSESGTGFFSEKGLERCCDVLVALLLVSHAQSIDETSPHIVSFIRASSEAMIVKFRSRMSTRGAKDVEVGSGYYALRYEGMSLISNPPLCPSVACVCRLVPVASLKPYQTSAIPTKPRKKATLCRSLASSWFCEISSGPGKWRCPRLWSVST